MALFLCARVRPRPGVSARLWFAALVALGAAASPLPGQEIPSTAANDSSRRSRQLDTVRVNAPSAPRTMTFLSDRYRTVLLTGSRTEAVLVDSMGANTAQNVARQVLGRVPGLTVAETEGSGFPSNGIALRGLNPTQSIEMNVRQDGVIIAADPYGYPETYYAPPMEAVERVEIIRGAGALQFGPQLGGIVNYVMRRGVPSRVVAPEVQHTVGSFGLANTYGSLGGEHGRWRWFSYVQRHSQQGWRPNSDNLQTSGYAGAEVELSHSLTASANYSLLRNRIHMPGGLSDAQFAGGARQSFRARNWLTTPWNVASVTLDWRPAPNVRIQSLTSALGSSRSLVWRNEDGGPSAVDEIDPATGQFVPREVEREGFRNITEELRMLADYRLFGAGSTLSTGVRWFNGTMHRQGGGPGSTGTDFDLALDGGRYEYDIRFANANVAAWAENSVRLGERLTLLPGIRLETLASRADGYTDTTFAPQERRRVVPLAGLGASWIASATTGIYANATQSYRPIDYSALTPVGSVSRIDPRLHDTKGVNADLGWRGTVADDRIRFDVGVFRLAVNGRIGLTSRTDVAGGGATFTERTNVANSVHRGLESYVELTPFAAQTAEGTARRSVTVFNSLALIDARYSSGEFDGKRVEYAPRFVQRTGLTIAAGGVGTTFLASVVGDAYGDANNTELSEDAVVGRVPRYTVLDWSASARLRDHWRVQAGVNNASDRHYFTRRTDEYPGPGIIPAIGRSFYLSVRATP